MELIKMKCQSCGANLEVDPDREFMFCKYCGEKQLINDGTSRVEINNVIRDEAQIKHEEVNMKNAVASAISVKELINIKIFVAPEVKFGHKTFPSNVH